MQHHYAATSGSFSCPRPRSQLGTFNSRLVRYTTRRGASTWPRSLFIHLQVVCCVCGAGDSGQERGGVREEREGHGGVGGVSERRAAVGAGPAVDSGAAEEGAAAGAPAAVAGAAEGAAGRRVPQPDDQGGPAGDEPQEAAEEAEAEEGPQAVMLTPPPPRDVHGEFGPKRRR